MTYDEMVAAGYGYVRHCGADYFVGPDKARHCPGCGQRLSGRVRDAETTIAEESSNGGRVFPAMSDWVAFDPLRPVSYLQAWDDAMYPVRAVGEMLDAHGVGRAH